jgi:hypothetical protein
LRNRRADRNLTAVLLSVYLRLAHEISADGTKLVPSETINWEQTHARKGMKMLVGLRGASFLCMVCSIMLLVLSCPPVFAENPRGVSGRVLIDAPPQKVWTVLTATGNFNDKLQSVNGDEAIVEQKFGTLPLMGSETVVVKAKVKNMDRIDFEMIKSDHFKAFSGAWSIAPAGSDKTHLNLKMDVDPGLPVPRVLVNMFVSGKVKSRLKKVKALAEESNRKQSADRHEAHR